MLREGLTVDIPNLVANTYPISLPPKLVLWYLLFIIHVNRRHAKEKTRS